MDASKAMWKTHFDGAQSRESVEERMVFTSPHGETTFFTQKLEFECTNNTVKYGALLLGLDMAREMKIKVLKVTDDFDSLVMQVRIQYAAINDRLKKYKHVVWNSIELFDAFSIVVVSREENVKANALVVATTTLQPCESHGRQSEYGICVHAIYSR